MCANSCWDSKDHVSASTQSPEKHVSASTQSPEKHVSANTRSRGKVRDTCKNTPRRQCAEHQFNTSQAALCVDEREGRALGGCGDSPRAQFAAPERQQQVRTVLRTCNEHANSAAESSRDTGGQCTILDRKGLVRTWSQACDNHARSALESTADAHGYGAVTQQLHEVQALREQCCEHECRALGCVHEDAKRKRRCARVQRFVP
jgi:hypothetical protein